MWLALSKFLFPQSALKKRNERIFYVTQTLLQTKHYKKDKCSSIHCFSNAILQTRKFSAILLQIFAVIWSIVMHVFRIWYDICRTSKDLFIYSSLLCYWNTFQVSLCLLLILILQDSQLQITHSSSPSPLKYKRFHSAF